MRKRVRKRIRVRVRMMLWVCLGVLCCTGTPVPIPTPISSRAVHISAPEDGKVVIAGLPGSVSRGQSVTASTGTFTASSPVASTGSFAVLLNADASSDVRLVVRVDSEPSEPLTVTVPLASGHPSPKASASLPQNGKVTLTGTASAGDKIIVALPRTGTAMVVAASSKGAFNASVSAVGGDRVHLFAVDAQARSSKHTTLVVSAQTVIPPCADVDGDGYGAKGTDLRDCKSSTTKEDCNDGQNDVYPGQKTFFSVAIPGTSGSFDYDCDGKDELENASLEACAKAQKCAGQGWLTTVPACGLTGNWVQCVMSKSCVAGAPTARVQRCR